MKVSTKFIKSVYSKLYERLASLGFQKRKTGILSLKVTEDTIGWLGLNSALGRGGGILEINPVLGVRNQRIEKLVADLDAEPFNELIPPTLAGNVGYMRSNSRYLPFLFTEGVSPDGVADDLVESVKLHGLPFIKANSDLSTLLNSMMTSRFAIPPYVAYRIPVALDLLGKHEDAESFIRLQLEEIDNRIDPATEHYRAFAGRFLARKKVQ